MQPLVEFAPDLPPTAPGVLLDVVDLIPTARGYKGRPAPVSGGYPALGAAANALAVITKLDGSRRVLAGTAAALYEAGGGAWTDRSEVGGYAIGQNRWAFAQFGDTTLAAAKAATLQASNSGAFAAVGGAPKASYVDTSGGFVMLADTNDGTYGDQADRWWCSAYLDYTDWVPDVTTQCTTGRLVDSPGPITALKALGSGFVAYKANAMWVAQYVGPPQVWQWLQVPGEIGCSTPHGVVSIGSAHAFIGRDNIWLFDGARPIPIGDKIRNWFFRQFNSTYAFRTLGAYDPIAGNVWWHYVSTAAAGTTPDRALVFNVRTGRFGTARLDVEAAALYYQPGLTYDGIGSVYSTWDSLPVDLSYDSPVWNAARPDYAVIDTAHALQTLTGASISSSLLTGNVGDDDQFTTCQGVRPRFLVEPATAQLEHLYDDHYGDVFTSLGSVGLYEGKFDTLWSSRWHRFRLSFTGDVEINGIRPRVAPDGDA